VSECGRIEGYVAREDGCPECWGSHAVGSWLLVAGCLLLGYS
jgi:hypothetical protein